MTEHIGAWPARNELELLLLDGANTGNTYPAGVVESMQGRRQTNPRGTATGSEADYSGRFVTHIPKLLHADLVKLAKRQNVSLSQHILYLLPPCAATFGEARM